MKKWYSVTDKSETNKRWFLSLMGGAAWLGLICLPLLLSACRSETRSQGDTHKTESSAQEAQEIGDNIKNSYARLASKRSDVCPKLIQDDVGRSVVERTEEVMVNDYCDYFLYPKSGQQISVSVDNAQIEALLIVPTLHNFANGDYQVKSYDKHVVRLTYNGATYKPKDLVYDIAVTLTDTARTS